jgi:DNA polymerase I
MSRELYLLDGYSVIYRGYFAFLKRPLLNPQGRNTSSVFVFFRTLFQLVRDRSPGYIAVVMDSRVPTFRHERYDEYKANREKAPEDLHAQVPVIEEILAALGVPCVRADRYEADDVIATLAERCRATGRPVWILSGDKDIMQLVGGNVRLLAQEKGAGDIAEYAREKVFEAKGVYPEQIIDFLALTGDSSDNVPGVAGIGEKTAQKLLAQHGSLDAIYATLSAVTPESVRRKLEAGRASAYLSQELVTLHRDVPGLPDVDSLEFAGFNAAAAIPLFEREGMRSLVAELGGGAPAAGAPAAGTPAAPSRAAAEQAARGGPAPAAALPAAQPAAPVVLQSTTPGTYTPVTSLAELDQWIARARQAGLYAFDVETDNLDEMLAVPLGIALSCEEGKACYVPLRAAGVTCLPEQAVRQRLAQLLEDPSLRLVGQNCKYDYKVMRRWGLRPANVHFDTMVAAWVLESDEGTYGLDRQAEKRLSYRTTEYNDIVGKGQTLEQVPLQTVADYSGEDADLTLRLYRLLAADLEREGLAKLFHEIEMPLLTVLAEMELTGIRILTPELAAYGREMESALATLEGEIYALCGRKFNINSTRQLQEILFTWRKLTPVKKTKTGFSTDVDVLEILAAQDPVPEKILQHRKLSKLKSTYVDALPVLVNESTGRLHTHYVQTGAATGRLASKDPNLQNIPIREEEGRRIRAAFVPAPGMKFISADYSQIELAILATLAGDEVMLDAFRQGKDIHRQTAALIFGVTEAEVSPDQRRVAKTVNFGIVYGMSAFGLAQGLKIPRGDADRFIKTYFQRFPAVEAFIRKTIRGAEETGFVRTLFGRRRRIIAIRSQNRTEKTAAERVAVNSPIQGTAADIVKIAMVNLSRRLAEEHLGARILLQVHDEIILEAPEEETARAEQVVREVMEAAAGNAFDGTETAAGAAFSGKETAAGHGIPLSVHCESADSWGAFH